MSLIPRTYPKTKTLGQVYTPPLIVHKILDELAYNSPAMLQKTILDPACGDGRFLLEAVKRIIHFSPLQDLSKNLEKVYGWDIDALAIHNCIQNLDELIQPLGIEVNWQIATLDSLHKAQSPRDTFDYIIGNPPYIRIQHLEESQRKYIQTHYHFCKSGSTDIYLAFFELCEHLLSPQGICGLITPNTYFYTETARTMRNTFAQQENIRKIINFGQIQVFDNATTYSAITIFSKAKNASFIYQQAKSLRDFGVSKKMALEELKDKKAWRLSVESQPKIQGVRLGEICQIGVGLATLFDKGYVFSSVQTLKNGQVRATSKLNGEAIRLESALLKPIIKASTYKSGEAIKEYILFPYYQVEGSYQIIPERDLQKRYPLSYKYLKGIKKYLDLRDKGKKRYHAWYAFGRKQSLDNGFGAKIIFSPMNKKPNFIFSDVKEATIYSGYYLKFKSDPQPERYHKLLQELNSPRMASFIAISSRDFRGGWKAYNKKVIEDFIIDPNRI